MPNPTLGHRALGRFAHRSPTAILLPVMILAAISTPRLAPAQAGSPRPIVVALPDVFPEVEARSLIVRTPERDMVVLRDDGTTSQTLLMSLSLLETLRTDEPRPEAGQVIPITGFAVRRAPSEDKRRKVEATLRRLREAPPTRVGDLGPGRWIPLPG